MNNIILALENELLQEQLEMKDLYIECMDLEFNEFLYEDNSLNLTFKEKLKAVIKNLIERFEKLIEIIKRLSSKLIAKLLDFCQNTFIQSTKYNYYASPKVLDAVRNLNIEFGNSDTTMIISNFSRTNDKDILKKENAIEKFSDIIKDDSNYERIVKNRNVPKGFLIFKNFHNSLGLDRDMFKDYEKQLSKAKNDLEKEYKKEDPNRDLIKKYSDSVSLLNRYIAVYTKKINLQAYFINHAYSHRSQKVDED